MDNSENTECSEAKPPSAPSVKQSPTKPVESDVDHPVLTNGTAHENGMNGVKNFENGSYDIEANENESNGLKSSSHFGENGVHCSHALQNGTLEVVENAENENCVDELKEQDNSFKDEESQTANSLMGMVKADPEIPFSHYAEEISDEVSEMDGSGDRRHNGAGRRSVTSPTKPSTVQGVQLKRLSSRDVYPDRETEDFEDSDEDSSDEENDEVIGQSDVRGSPKSRRKRSDSCPLFWSDEKSLASTMRHSDVFRRSKQFCDLILQVGGREIHCHRVIVAGASRFLYKELGQGEKENSSPIVRITLNQIQPPLSPEAVESLVDYMYTARLLIPQGQLTSIYCASMRLKLDRVMPLCRSHITNQLDAKTCVKTWRLASSVDDFDLLKILDEFIEDNFEAVTKSNDFLALPRIRMVVVTSNLPSDVSPLHVLPRDGSLGNLALSWVKGKVQRNGGSYIEELMEQIQKITLEELTNALPASCFSSPSSTSSSTSSLGCNKSGSPNFATASESSGSKSSQLRRSSRTSSTTSLTESSSSEDSASHGRCKPDGLWKVIGSMQTGDHLIALCSIGDVLSSMTLHVPTNLLSSGNLYAVNGTNGNCVSTSSSSSHSCSSSVGSVSDLSHLSQARCAGGVTALNGKIYAMGGYNKSECLDSVECYDPSSNKWMVAAKMAHRRARFTAAVMSGHIYVVGGSTGSRDVLTVDRYDPAQDKWFEAPSLPVSCSGVGVAVMNGRLYCIGGVQHDCGVAGIKLCHRLDPGARCWQYIAPLNGGRCFAGVAEFNGMLYCVGGTDGWVCLASVERYNGETWLRGPQLNVQRRGAGLAKHNDTLYCVGGSDGGSFWASVEQLSSDGESWTMLPTNMTVPRSNVGLVSLNGLLFAVGGFSGRQFLNTMETLGEGAEEWTTRETLLVADGCSCVVSGEDSSAADATS